MTSDLPHLPAAEALALFRARELSPVELMTAVIERAEAVEPAINAFAETFYEQAIAAAKAAQERYAGAGEPPRPLEGRFVRVPVRIGPPVLHPDHPGRLGVERGRVVIPAVGHHRTKLP